MELCRCGCLFVNTRVVIVLPHVVFVVLVMVVFVLVIFDDCIECTRGVVYNNCHGC